MLEIPDDGAHRLGDKKVFQIELIKEEDTVIYLGGQYPQHYNRCPWSSLRLSKTKNNLYQRGSLLNLLAIFELICSNSQFTIINRMFPSVDLHQL